MSNQLFVNFRIAKFRFSLSPRTELNLPRYKGSTLRGAFGHVLRKVCCSFNREQDCKDCLLQQNCAYSYIFETTPPPDSKKISKIARVPQPFIIEPSLEEKVWYKQGEIFNFDLVLIGRGINYLPYLILAFRELGSLGIGWGRGKFDLVRVEAINERGERSIEIYSNENLIVKNFDSSFTFKDILEYKDGLTAEDSLKINYITPTRLKFRNSYVSKPEFHIFFRSVLRRISSLAYFHCEEDLEEYINFREILERAKAIEIEDIDVNWIDWERYSSRQDTRMRLGGVVGSVIYQGKLEEFIPYVLLGEQIHVGKNCAFGLGKYKIANLDTEGKKSNAFC